MRLSILLLIIISIALPAVAGGFLIEGTKGTKIVAVQVAIFDEPWAMTFLPDSTLLVTEKRGVLWHVTNDGSKTEVQGLWKVAYGGQGGLGDVVLHPDFSVQPIVYLAYTYNSGSGVLERIVSYNYFADELINESILLDNIPGSSNHDGCRLIISTDYKLFITTGDALNSSSAQDINSLSGKILRLNLDGSVPIDNPFPNNPVYSFGHRNAQGLYLGLNGILYSSEHGPSSDDEFNIIEAGRNYGWPDVKGYCDTPAEITFCNTNNVAEPLSAWTPTIATSDIVYYNHPAIPEWQGHILLTTLKNKRLYTLELDETGTAVLSESQFFQDYWGRLRDICVAPDGSVYLATNGPNWGNSQPFTHSIVKIWNPGLRLDLKAFLEGPFDYSTLEMKTDLNNMIPNDHPFGPNLPYFGNPMPDWYYNGSETVASIPNLDIVDWVMVELRDAPNVAEALPSTAVAKQAAFITRTGQIVDLDGSGLLSFLITPINNLYAVIWSRNHIGVISTNPLSECMV